MPGSDKPTARVVALIVLLFVVATALRGYLPAHDRPPRTEGGSNPAAWTAVVAALTRTVALLAVAVVARLRDPRGAPSSGPDLPVLLRTGTGRPSWRVLLVALGVIAGLLLALTLLTRVVSGHGVSPPAPGVTSASRPPAHAGAPPPRLPPPGNSGTMSGVLIAGTLPLLPILVVGTILESRRRRRAKAPADEINRTPPKTQARVDVIARGGLRAGTATVDAAAVIVFPLTPPQSTPIPQTELLDRLGSHLTRYAGPGVEYADVRAYVPGDQLRAVNWPVSARRRALHVTKRLTDRAADMVVLIDTCRQPAGPATKAAERTVRGAAQVVQTALRHGDRAGIVALGGNACRVARGRHDRGVRATARTRWPGGAVRRGVFGVASRRRRVGGRRHRQQGHMGFRPVLHVGRVGCGVVPVAVAVAVAVSFPLQLPWLPLLAPPGALATFVLAARPFT